MKRFGILLLILFTLTGCTSKSSFGEYEVIIREDSLYFINGTENYEEEGYNFHSVQKTLHVKDDFIYQIDTRYLLEENNATLKKYDSVLDLIEDTENIDYQYITIDKGGDLFEIETFSYFQRKEGLLNKIVPYEGSFSEYKNLLENNYDEANFKIIPKQ